MMEQSPELTHLHLSCPKCNYDLAGIIRENGTATCPECGSDLEKYSIVNPVSRWDRLALNCTLILIVPLLMFFVMLTLNNYFRLRWIASSPIVGYLVTTAGLLIWLSLYEAKKRRRWSNPPPRFKPPLWVFIPLMILFAAACATVEFIILMSWIWSQI